MPRKASDVSSEGQPTKGKSGGGHIAQSGVVATEACDVVLNGAASESIWYSLATTEKELNLSLTLTTGQTFRWRRTDDDEWTGVHGKRVVTLRQSKGHGDILFRTVPKLKTDELAPFEQSLVEFFNLRYNLEELYAQWSAADTRFAQVGEFLPGARVLRQDAVECVFSFLCSSNNNISRITSMVDYLSRTYGPLIAVVDGVEYFAFPALEDLARIPAADLRTNGSFGYRADWVPAAAQHIIELGGEPWLHGLRSLPREEAHASLTALQGVGKKVASCIALFCLDQAAEVPIDTHVWQYTCRHYLPALHHKSLTDSVYRAVGEFYRERFGRFAGWAHNALFIAELQQYRHLLPTHLTPKSSKKAAKPSPSPTNTTPPSNAASTPSPASKPRRKRRLSLEPLVENDDQS